MTNIEKAKLLLVSESTCVLVREDTTYVSNLRGIAPMIDYLSNGVDLKGFSAADRIVGKAAAMLFVKAGIKEVYAEVLSVKGKEFLEQNGINVTYETLTDKIINRTKTDICPMEKTVDKINDVELAFSAIKKCSEELKKQRS